MPRRATSWTFRGVPRIAVVATSAALGAAALCLVVFGSSQRQLQVGVLLGLWSALIAAYLVVGARHGESGQTSEADLADIRSRLADLREGQLTVVAGQQEQLEEARQAHVAQEIELRQFGERQCAREAAARREAELKLEISLRREIDRVLSEQLASLRAEVAALRAEVVDKLGGQLRLERIETTRVIGSDLEALQHEIRRLAAANQHGLAAPARAASTSAPAGPERQAAEILDAELVQFPPPALDLTDGQSAAQRAGRRRAPESESSNVRYQGRRRAEGDQASRSDGADS
jgi:hypothetical protein